MTGPILILTQQPIVAALVGMLVEGRGYSPAFARTDEDPIAAVQRLRPMLAVLIDVDLDATRSDLFFAAAARRGLGIVVFGPPGNARQIAEVATARRIPWFTLPPTAEQLMAAVDAARGARTDRRRAGAGSSAIPAGDGVSILEDSTGRRWIVYDRRGLDRRQPIQAHDLDRVFVGDDGETRHYPIDDRETGWSVAELERQLAQATT